MENKFCKLFLNLVAVFALLITLTTGLAQSYDTYNTEPDITSTSIYIDGELAWQGNCEKVALVDKADYVWICKESQVRNIAAEQGSTLEIKTTFVAGTDLDNVRVRAWIAGYHEDVENKTSYFDVAKGKTYTKTLQLKIPYDLDAKDYTLYVKVEYKQELSGVDEARINLTIHKASNVLEILSIELCSDGTQTNTFNAGENIFVYVVVKNKGNYKAEDVYVRAKIEELGLERKSYIGDLETGESEEAKIVLALPQNIKPGFYVLEVEAYTYNYKARDIEIAEIFVKPFEPEPQPRVEIKPQISSLEIEKGKAAIYTILITNGPTTQDFVIETVGTEGWATVTITPQTFKLGPGQSMTVNIYLAVSETAIEGEHIFSVKVKYNGKSESINLVAKVTEARPVDVKIILMIVGIVLAAIIIILLILLLSRKPEKEAETYY